MSADHMSTKETFLENLSEKLVVYEGCGNMLGIVPLTLAGYGGDVESWKKDPELRKMLTEWGKQIKSDSVMVLLGDPNKVEEQGYHVNMFVFEPSGDDGSGLGGGISTMCGNGIRAVASWVKDFHPGLKEASIMSMSGLRNVDIDGNLYQVDMGEFANSEEDLSRYVETEKAQSNEEGKYIDAPIPDIILKDLSKFTSTKTWSMGLTGTRDSSGIDGEPHIIIEIPKEEVMNIDGLRKLAVEAGPLVTKNLEVFPSEININFVVLDGVDGEGKFVIWNCTHERNLGSDADHSVTAACGTGSTVAGAVMFEKYINDPSQTVLVKNTGGPLEISLKDNLSPKTLLMKGPANRVSF